MNQLAAYTRLLNRVKFQPWRLSRGLCWSLCLWAVLGLARVAGGQPCAVAPAALDFGDTLIQEGASQELNITNTGAATLEVTDVAIGGRDGALFDVDASDRTIPATQNEVLVVRFVPQQAMPAEASLSLACDGESIRVPLIGSGIPLVIVVTPDRAPVAGAPLALTASLPDGYTPESQTLFYRATGRATYQSVDATLEGTRLRARVPADAVTARGLEYYLRFTRGSTVLTVPATNPSTNPIPLRVQVDHLNAAFTLPPLTYQMLSVPVDLNDPEPRAHLEDDFGALDTTAWRLFRWSSTHQAYHEGGGLASVFEPGNAFWVSTRSGGSFDVEGGRSVRAAGPYRITLDPGWNQVGTPFAFPVAWEDVAGSDGVEAPVYYDGVDYRYDQTRLRPWLGYFVHNPTAEPVELAVPPVEAPFGVPGKSARAPRDPPTLYALRLQAYVVGSDLQDVNNVVGFTDDSVPALNRLSVTEAPPVGAHVRLSIIVDDRRLARSIEPWTGEGQMWPLRLSVSDDEASVLRRQRTVRLHLTEQGPRPDRFGVFVLDEAGRSVDLVGGTLSIDVTLGDETRLWLIVGSAPFAEVQQASLEIPEVRLASAYPNPSQGALTFAYELDERRWVTLTIYDVLGRRVRTLVAGSRSAGRHTDRWDGRDDARRSVPAGLYLAQLSTGSYQATRQVIVQR